MKNLRKLKIDWKYIIYLKQKQTIINFKYINYYLSIFLKPISKFIIIIKLISFIFINVREWSLI